MVETQSSPSGDTAVDKIRDPFSGVLSPVSDNVPD